METVWSYKQVGNVCPSPEAGVPEGRPLRLGWGPGRGGLAQALPRASWMNTLQVAPQPTFRLREGSPSLPAATPLVIKPH